MQDVHTATSSPHGIGFMAFFAFMLIGGGLVGFIIYLILDVLPSSTGPSVASSPTTISGPSPQSGSGPGGVVNNNNNNNTANVYSLRPGSRLSGYGGARATLYGPDSTYKHVVWPSGSSRAPIYCVNEKGACSSGAIPLAMIPAHVTSMDVPEGYALEVSGVPNKGTITIPHKSLEYSNPDSTHFGPGEVAFSNNKNINAMVAQHTKALRFTLVRI